MLTTRVQQALDVAIARNPDLETELKALAAWLCDALAQRAARAEPVRADGNQKEGTPRLRLRFTRHGSRLLDLDNLAGGFKHLQDALKEEHLLPDDDPGTVAIEFHQRKVKRSEMGTEIIIEPIP